MERLDPLTNSPAWAIMGLLALAILAVYALGRGRESIGPATLLRIFAVAGIIVPGMTILGWYRQILRAREWARELPIRPDSIVERFMTSSAALLSAGFLILVGGIYLARRLPDRPPRARRGTAREASAEAAPPATE